MPSEPDAATRALPPAVSGELIQTTGPAGRVAVYVAGSGPPLLLVHSVNAAASAAEVRPLHEHFCASRTVCSVDLPGFGASERSDRVYSPRLMTDALLQVLAALAARGHLGAGGAGGAGGPVDALAVSTGCEFLARAAAEEPGLFRRLALVSPTGLRGEVPRRGPPGATRGLPWLHRALRGPGWGGALYRGLTRPAVIRYFLRRTWGARDVDEALWAYDVLTARLPGAEYAPLYFLSAGLFSADILSIYEALSQPVWLSHGVRGDFTDYRGRRFLEGRSNWRFSVYSTGALPHFEVTESFCADLEAFLTEPADPSGAAPSG
jgi:pimeloyl-ACP methyl ester carboxylesterase